MEPNMILVDLPLSIRTLCNNAAIFLEDFGEHFTEVVADVLAQKRVQDLLR